MSEFCASDLGAAAFLTVRGFPLLGIVPEGGGRYAFQFADPKGTAPAIVMEYLQGGSVPAKALLEAQKSLKTLLYSQKNGNGYGTTFNSRCSR